MLVVTDDETVRKLLGRLLTGEGLQLIYADDGEQAVAVVARLRPELAVIFAQATRGMRAEAKWDRPVPATARNGDD